MISSAAPTKPAIASSNNNANSAINNKKSHGRNARKHKAGLKAKSAVDASQPVPEKDTPAAYSEMISANDQPSQDQQQFGSEKYCANSAAQSQEMHTQPIQSECLSHLYEKGFLSGLFSDVTVCGLGQQYKLHRLILARSPLFERIFLSRHSIGNNNNLQYSHSSTASSFNSSFYNHGVVANSNSGNHAVESIDLLPNAHSQITREALSICISYLYGAPIAALINASNAQSVLACACLLEMGNVATLATDCLIQSIDPSNCLSLVAFVSSALAVDENNGGNMVFSFYDRIRVALLEYLACTLPTQLQAFPTVLNSSSCFSQESVANAQRRLVDIFKQLPLDWLRVILEEKLQTPREYEKYMFARQVMESRRLAKLGNESVVLLFDRDAKGRVSLK